MRSILLFSMLSMASAIAQAQWVYSEREDKMSGDKLTTASVRSANSLSLGFPYAGTNHGTLIVRRHPKHGLGVIVRVDKGQILCRTSDRCSVQVRFDDAKPTTFSGSPSDDHSSDVVFLNNESRFIDLALKAKRILIQVSMYQAGYQVLEFEPGEVLKWDRSTKAMKVRLDGQELAQQASCNVCHLPDRKLVGPSYSDIKKRYAGNGRTSEILVRSIANGSSGKYGQVPMPGNPQVNLEEARAIVAWIMDGAK